jgi:hypothetical protein
MEGDKPEFGKITKDMLESHRRVAQAPPPVELFEELKKRYPKLSFLQLQDKLFDDMVEKINGSSVDAKKFRPKNTACGEDDCKASFEVDSLDWSGKKEVQTEVWGNISKLKIFHYAIPCPKCGKLSVYSPGDFKVKE